MKTPEDWTLLLEARAELATLKRQHEQLRAAALRFYVDQGEPITDASIELVEVLDAKLPLTATDFDQEDPVNEHIETLEGWLPELTLNGPTYAAVAFAISALSKQGQDL